MSFDPAQFLRVADGLAQNSGDEASLRTAIGRAYYAVFLAARERLSIATRTGRVHQEVVGRLRRRDVSSGNQLDKLEELRGLADYNLNVVDPLQRNWETNWKLSRAYANYVRERLGRLR